MSEQTLAPVRLSGWDFATWRAASEDPIMRSTMVGLLVLDGPPDWDRLVDRYERASRLVPILRQKVVEGPVPWANPRLLVDPDFDLSFHLVRFRMPDDCTWDDVLDECRRQSMTDFDRDRPLWRVTVLEGLPGGRAGVITKLHHAVADGQGAIQLGAALVDLTPEGVDLGPMPRAPQGEQLSPWSFLELMVRDNVDWVSATARSVAKYAIPAAAEFMQSPGDAVRQLAEIGDSLLRFARPPSMQLSPIMVGRSINYHYGAFQVPFGDFRASVKAVGHTVNDGYLAAVAAGMGEYHRRQGAPVAELNLNMPISLRKSGDFGQNAVTIAHFTIPTGEHHPSELMDTVSRTVAQWRSEPALGFADELGEISRFIPFDVISSAATASDVTASNVPGPPVTVYLAGAKVEDLVPLPPPVGAAVFVALLTYSGQATLGIAMDDRAVTDKDLLMECLRWGFEQVLGKPVEVWDPFATPEPAPEPPTPAKKPAPKKAAPKKPAQKPAAQKPAAQKRAASKAKPVAKKPAAQKAPAKKPAAKKPAAKKSAAEKTPAS